MTPTTPSAGPKAELKRIAVRKVASIKLTAMCPCQYSRFA